MILRCEVCETDLGTFDPDALTLPLTGAMFGPLTPAYSAPFQPEAGWDHMYCPICSKRALGWDFDSPDLVRPDRLLTPGGYFIVGQGLEQTGPAPYVHDSSDLAREWEAAEAVRRQDKRPVEQARKGKRR